MILHVIAGGTATPGAPPLVLLHGLFGAARNFGAVMRHLAPRHRVLALDLRNHGASPHAPGMDYDTLAKDVQETLASQGLGAAAPFVLLGHSMGGKIAMRLALRAPQIIAQLVVADIAPKPYRPVFGAYARAMQDIPLRPGLARDTADAALRDAVPEAAIRAFLLQNLAFGATPDASPAWRIGLEHIAAGMADIVGWAPPPEDARFTGPCLIMAGARSDYIRPADRPEILRLFPRARFLALKDAGHWLHADNPAGFMAVLDAVMDRATRDAP